MKKAGRLSIAPRDRDVACEQRHKAAAETIAVHHGDDRLRRARDAFHIQPRASAETSRTPPAYPRADRGNSSPSRAQKLCSAPVKTITRTSGSPFKSRKTRNISEDSAGLIAFRFVGRFNVTQATFAMISTSARRPPRKPAGHELGLFGMRMMQQIIEHPGQPIFNTRAMTGWRVATCPSKPTSVPSAVISRRLDQVSS